MANIARAALDLHTDLTNLETYKSNRPLLTELVLQAENRIAVIQAHIDEVRVAAGMAGSSVVLLHRAEG